METNTQQERAKRLEQQAREYLMQSNDPIFTRYLQQLLPRIQRQPEYVEQLQAELDKSVEFWYQRQQINANRGGETGAESSVPQQSVPQETAAGEQQTAGQSQTQPVGQFTMQQVQAPATQAPAQKKQNAEYLVATIALSVVGGIFILTALVLLGMYFMNGWIKGISLYAVSLGVVLIAELLIHRKLPKLARIFSAIGIAALYLSTMINTISLHNFPDTQNAGNRSMLALCVSAFRFFIAFGAGRPAGAGIDSVTECTEHLCAGKKISYGFAVDTTCQHYDPFPGNGILCDQYTGNAGLGDSSCIWNLFPDRTSDPGSAEQLHTKRKTGGPCSE